MSDISKHTGRVAADLATMVSDFRERNRGAVVRGQVVEHAELVIDTLDRGVPRYIISLVFQENPPTNESPEMNMLQRVFSEIPKGAYITTSDAQEAHDILLSDASDSRFQWRLDDEWSCGD